MLRQLLRARPLAALASVSFTLATACGGEKPSAKGAATGAKTFTIAMIAKSSTNPVFLSARQGADSAAAELSATQGVTVKVDWLTPPNEDGAVQAQRISEAANSGANAILLSASDASKVRGAVDEAVARGVPVMTFDSDVADSKRFSFYGGDDVLMGAQVMDELASQMGGKGRVAIIAGNQNALNLQARVRGVRETAAKYPGITIVNAFFHAETPQDAAAEVLRVMRAYPDVQGFAMIGGWALFTSTLLTDLDPKRVKIVSIDALPAELPYIEAGLAPVLFAQRTFEWGYVSVKTIFEHVYLRKEVPAKVPMDLVKVSKENLGTWARQLKAWGFSGVDPKYLALPQ